MFSRDERMFRVTISMWKGIDEMGKGQTSCTLGRTQYIDGTDAV